MPRMNGINCLTELKKDAQLKDIPVVIYSTTSYEQETKEMLHLGAFAFIIKPTSLQKLIKKFEISPAAFTLGRCTTLLIL